MRTKGEEIYWNWGNWSLKIMLYTMNIHLLINVSLFAHHPGFHKSASIRCSAVDERPVFCKVTISEKADFSVVQWQNHRKCSRQRRLTQRQCWSSLLYANQWCNLSLSRKRHSSSHIFMQTFVATSHSYVSLIAIILWNESAHFWLLSECKKRVENKLHSYTNHLNMYFVQMMKRLAATETTKILGAK